MWVRPLFTATLHTFVDLCCPLGTMTDKKTEIGIGCLGCKAGLPREKSMIVPGSWIHNDSGVKLACTRVDPSKVRFQVDLGAAEAKAKLYLSQEEERAAFKTAWIEMLERCGGRSMRAYEHFPVHRITLLRWRRKDEHFDRAWSAVLAKFRPEEAKKQSKKSRILVDHARKLAKTKREAD